MLHDTNDQIQGATNGVNQQTNARDSRLQAAGKAQRALADKTTERDADATYLADLKTDCKLKKENFAERQKLRKEEIHALDEAIEILSSEKVAGNVEKHLTFLDASTVASGNEEI